MGLHRSPAVCGGTTVLCVNDTADITLSQASVLARLSKSGPATASDLAALEGVRPQSMATTIGSLSRLGQWSVTPIPRTAESSASLSPTPAVNAPRGTGRPVTPG